MKTKKEIKNWLLENAIDEEGDLDLDCLDFSDFEKNIYIGNMEIGGNLYQYNQNVGGDLYQDNQKVKGILDQSYQKVGGRFITQTLENDEKYEINECGSNCIVKKIQKYTYEELKEKLGSDFEIIEK